MPAASLPPLPLPSRQRQSQPAPQHRPQLRSQHRPQLRSQHRPQLRSQHRPQLRSQARPLLRRSCPAPPGLPALIALLALLLPQAMAVLLAPGDALAGVAQREQIYHVLFDAPCRRFRLPKDVAMAIARQESDGHPLMINVEGRDLRPASLAEACALVDRLWREGRSFDVGLMQINVLWMRRYRIPPRLLLNPRNNVFMGCFLLAMQARQAGSLWKGVGHYHSRTPWRRDRYIAQVRRHLERLHREAGRGLQG